jgi:hypothetical protein
LWLRQKKWQCRERKGRCTRLQRVCGKYRRNTGGLIKDKQGKLLTTEKNKKRDGQNTKSALKY